MAFNRKPLAALGLCLSLCLPAAAETTKKPVVDEYHGHRIADDYRWLEDFSDPAVRRWNEEQNQRTRAYLDRLPSLPAIRARVRELLLATSASYTDLHHAGGVLFARKFKPPREQAMLVALASADDTASERVLLDPVQLNDKGTTTIDFYVPSHDGALVAVSLSDRGTEDGTVHVYDVKTGTELAGDTIPRVNGGTAGGSLAWNADRSGFYYTRYPRGTERPRADLGFYQQVYFHRLGTRTETDSYSLGKDFPRIAETELLATEDGRYVLAQVQNGDGGEYAHYLLGPAGPDAKWQPLTRYTDKVVGAAFGRDGSLYLLSRQGAPHGKVLRVPLDRPRLAQAAVVVPESDAVIAQVVPASTRLYVLDLVGGMSQVRLLGLDGKGPGETQVPVKPVSAVDELLRLSGDEVLYRSQTFVDPPAWFRYRPGDARPARTALRTTSPVDFGDIEVKRDFAASKDGTKVPLTVLSRRGTKLDGRNPTVLTGYGGFGVSLTPRFRVLGRLWLEQGGVSAVANLRGGGEYGEEWHHAGYLRRKQNVFDDFIACAEHLIARKYTDPQHLGIEGGSNGGLLMGAVTTQRPELFRAVVTHVGIYDMLRFALYPNGAFNVTEYGSVKDPADFQALHAYSPYHRVKDGTAYPAMLFTAGENDPRVNPADSRKMVARLQAATSSGRPILLRTSSASGHHASSLSEEVAEISDVLAFKFAELGVAYKAPKPRHAERGGPSVPLR